MSTTPAPDTKLPLRLGHPLDLLQATPHNGPGWRINLWFQGCSIRCTENCLNPQFLDPKKGYVYDLDTVLQVIQDTVRQDHRKVEGVTILGGEPTDQAEPLAILLEQVQAMGLSTMVYSGHPFEKLKNLHSKFMQRVLDSTDILVDSPFIPELYGDALMWRGSSNQRVLCLSDRYTPDQLESAFSRQGKGFSIQIKNGRVSVSGFQNREAAEKAQGWVRSISGRD